MAPVKGINIKQTHEKNQVDRKGIHAKTKSSYLKSSKNYKKRYIGQGR